jgi:hypothetical protein
MFPCCQPLGMPVPLAHSPFLCHQSQQWLWLFLTILSEYFSQSLSDWQQLGKIPTFTDPWLDWDSQMTTSHLRVLPLITSARSLSFTGSWDLVMDRFQGYYSTRHIRPDPCSFCPLLLPCAMQGTALNPFAGGPRHPSYSSYSTATKKSWIEIKDWETRSCRRCCSSQSHFPKTGGNCQTPKGKEKLITFLNEKPNIFASF